MWFPHASLQLEWKYVIESVLLVWSVLHYLWAFFCRCIWFGWRLHQLFEDIDEFDGYKYELYLAVVSMQSLLFHFVQSLIGGIFLFCCQLYRPNDYTSLFHVYVCAENRFLSSPGLLLPIIDILASIMWFVRHFCDKLKFFS